MGTWKGQEIRNSYFSSSSLSYWQGAAVMPSFPCSTVSFDKLTNTPMTNGRTLVQLNNLAASFNLNTQWFTLYNYADTCDRNKTLVNFDLLSFTLRFQTSAVDSLVTDSEDGRQYADARAELRNV